jgi:hypothetical protein
MVVIEWNELMDKIKLYNREAIIEIGEDVIKYCQNACCKNYELISRECLTCPEANEFMKDKGYHV